jgi:ParB-like chromosome segregation protein Spo0J
MDMMPIRVNALGDGTYTVKDGRHRIQAHLDAGLAYILATVENIIETIKRFLSRIAGFLFEL